MRTNNLTRSALALAVLAATLVVVAPASAQEEQELQDEQEGCEPVVDYAFRNEGNATVELDEVQAGENVTVLFELQGCGETELSFVSHTMGLAMASSVFDSDTGVFTDGTGSLTIQVPDCTFELDFVFGSVIEAGGSTLYDVRGDLIAAAQGGVGLCLPDVELPDVTCPSLTAKANGDGSIGLEVDAAATAGALLLYRAAGDDGMELIALVDGTAYLDTETEVGVTYRYAVVAVLGELEEECGVVEVTSIPVFPGALGMVAATTIGLLGYLASRRR